MPSTGIGVYGGSASLTENDEISSTYEGRHITVNESDVTGHEHTYVTKGHPVVVGEHIVGVALNTGTVADELIAIDTEGIWALNVYATDELGNVAVAPGDALYIHRTTGLISKNNNKDTHTLLGYALGTVPAGVTPYVIGVKLHWSPDDQQELVGVAATPLVSARAGITFREYYYEAQGGGIIEALRTELAITTVRAVTACVNYNKLMIAGDSDIIGGRSSVIEARLEILAGDQMSHTTTVMCLDWSCLNTSGLNNYVNAYCMLRDRTHAAVGQIRSLFHFMDHAALPDGGVTLGNAVLQDANTDRTSDVRITCSYGPTLSLFWLLGTTTAPD